MRALSVRQPWAELIISGRKQYEVRSWKPPVLGRILIHASARMEAESALRAGLDPQQLATGALLGTVEVTGWLPVTTDLAASMRAARSPAMATAGGTHFVQYHNSAKMRYGCAEIRNYQIITLNRTAATQRDGPDASASASCSASSRDTSCSIAVNSASGSTPDAGCALSAVQSAGG